MKQKSKCKAERCRHDAASAGLCSKHYSKKWRAENPMRSCFLIRRSNAKRRKKIWTLTYIQFIFFANQTGYLHLTGRRAWQASIDCFDPVVGYTFTNIRSITVSENSQKGNRLIYKMAELNHVDPATI